MPLDEYQQATLQECMQREGCPCAGSSGNTHPLLIRCRFFILVKSPLIVWD